MRMVKNFDELIAALPPQRQKKIARRAAELASLRDLRLAATQTQQDLARTLGVGQDAISRLEQRSDMLISTLRRYVEAMGGKLEIVARFPDRPSIVIDRLSVDERSTGSKASKRPAKNRAKAAIA